MTFIECKQIVKAYKITGHEVVALKGIDFSMERGEMVAIIGPSGAGKSSLLNLLGGLDKPTAGQLTVNGENLLELKGRTLTEYRLRKVGFLWQQVERNLLAHRNALTNVTLPMMLASIGWRERRQRAIELLEAVGLSQYVHSYPAQLSGGQQQRVAMAVALANRPQLLLADEPTGALDRTTAMQAMALMDDLRRRFNLTILMVTHDLEVAALADRVLTLRDGSLGQDLTGHADNDSLKFDESGRIRLPDVVKSHLSGASQIAVEIRPEGVLLRPEMDDTDEALTDAVPEDQPPEKRRWFRRRKTA
ncbi:MAG TPA: ABC transporter ATP-binding protein [Phototrophicaceae bacterium]|jgi:ABC-type lipoprotein export system ATPase subunit|nr:ABC transporter ATP-binding protein [Phototrophicaceae bacterium]